VTEHAQLFERNRRRLHGLAYGLLGSLADANDMLQDLVRWHGAGLRELHSPEAWQTTVLTRLCIDRMRARDPEDLSSHRFARLSI
jgi:RNA polymerase sigma-70 factor (ECF subfamily)